MRILVMSGTYPPHYLGGAELSCQNQARELQKRGHTVFVLTSYWQTSRPAICKEVYRLLHYERSSLLPSNGAAGRDPLRLRRRWSQISRACALSRNYGIAREVVAAVQPDVVYAWQMECASITPVLAAQDRRVPVILRLPDYWLALLRSEIYEKASPLKKWYREAVIGLGGFGRLDTRHMLPISNAIRQSYVEAGFPAAAMEVIPEGIPSEWLMDSELPAQFAEKDEVRVLFAGRLVQEKGLDVAIRALSCLMMDSATRPVKLDIIGAGHKEYVGELKALVESLGLAGRVTFLGQKDQKELLSSYGRYRALLFTSRWVEPWGVTVLEAMSRGLPVIATNQGGPAEIISDGVNGLLVPPNDPVLLAQAVKRLLLESELAERIRRSALETVREKYTNERIVDRVEEYLAAVSQTAPPVRWKQN